MTFKTVDKLENSEVFRQLVLMSIQLFKLNLFEHKLKYEYDKNVDIFNLEDDDIYYKHEQVFLKNINNDSKVLTTTLLYLFGPYLPIDVFFDVQSENLFNSEKIINRLFRYLESIETETEQMKKKLNIKKQPTEKEYWYLTIPFNVFSGYISQFYHMTRTIATQTRALMIMPPILFQTKTIWFLSPKILLSISTIVFFIQKTSTNRNVDIQKKNRLIVALNESIVNLDHYIIRFENLISEKKSLKSMAKQCKSLLYIESLKTMQNDDGEKIQRMSTLKGVLDLLESPPKSLYKLREFLKSKNIFESYFIFCNNFGEKRTINQAINAIFHIVINPFRLDTKHKRYSRTYSQRSRSGGCRTIKNVNQTAKL